MAKPRVDAGGGFASIRYVFGQGRRAGLANLYRRLRSANACKACALGMGGARGGMVDERGRFPTVCKKSVQAVAADLSAPIPEGVFSTRSIDALGRLGSRRLQALGRLSFPLLATADDSHFRRISWDEAEQRLIETFSAADPARTFFYVSGRSSNEAAFLLQLVARAYGTANIHNCSYYCHTASGVALSDVYGSGTASIVLDDLGRADLALLAGANPASNHPRLVGRLIELRRRGGRVIVVNPLRELGLTRFRIPSDPRSLLFGSRVSDLYLQPHIGGDVALFRAILLGILERGGVDRDFVDRATNGFDDVERDLRGASRDELVSASGVPRDRIDAAAEMLCAAERGILAWAMGLTHHRHGVDNVLALANIALARGWLGRPGAGLLPIRGHSNVQGIGSVGVTPELKRAFAERLEDLFDIRVPAETGQDTFASMEAAASGEIDAAWLLGGNLWASNPHLDWAGVAMRRIPFTVSLTTHLNEGHVHGRGQTSLILPALARDEETQRGTTESMFNLVRSSEGGQGPPGEARSEVDIVASFAQGVLPKDRFDWSMLRSHHALRQAIARVVPGYAAIASETNEHDEFQIEGRTFHVPEFATEDGRARFHVTPLPAFDFAADAFRLMTLRSEGQFNTVVYEDHDLYRGNTRRDVVMLSAEDARCLDLSEGDHVRVRTSVGSLEVIAAIVDIRPGNIAMYYPEANAIVPARLDERSRTPAFKSVEAWLEPVTRATSQRKRGV